MTNAELAAERARLGRGSDPAPDAQSAGTRGIARLGATAVAWLAFGLISGLAICLSLPNLLGYRALTVVTGSMEPALETGSVVLSKEISALDARPGDIVTFAEPNGDGRLLTHRVRRIRYEGGTAHVTTIGDANDVAEHWSVPTAGTIGRVAFVLPKAGHVRAAISNPRIRLAMLGVVAALGLFLLVDIWRPRHGGRS